eukprot:gene15358-1081_t
MLSPATVRSVRSPAPSDSPPWARPTSPPWPDDFTDEDAFHDYLRSHGLGQYSKITWPSGVVTSTEWDKGHECFEVFEEARVPLGLALGRPVDFRSVRMVPPPLPTGLGPDPGRERYACRVVKKEKDLLRHRQGTDREGATSGAGPRLLGWTGAAFAIAAAPAIRADAAAPVTFANARVGMKVVLTPQPADVTTWVEQRLCADPNDGRAKTRDVFVQDDRVTNHIYVRWNHKPDKDPVKFSKKWWDGKGQGRPTGRVRCIGSFPGKYGHLWGKVAQTMKDASVKWGSLAQPWVNPWDDYGLGASQKAEVAYLDHTREKLKKTDGWAYEYDEEDVAQFMEGDGKVDDKDKGTNFYWDEVEALEGGQSPERGADTAVDGDGVGTGDVGTVAEVQLDHRSGAGIPLGVGWEGNSTKLAW